MATKPRPREPRSVPSTFRANVGRSIILAIRPRFAELIYSGKKTIEVRRIGPIARPQRVLVYETSPTRRLTGWFEVGRIVVLGIGEAWRRFGKRTGVSARGFRAYLRGARAAVLIEVKRAVKLLRGVELRGVSRRMRPPQSWVYAPLRAEKRVLSARRFACA